MIKLPRLLTTAVLAAATLLGACGSGTGSIASNAGLLPTFLPVGSGPMTRAELLVISDDLTALNNSTYYDDLIAAQPAAAFATYDGVLFAEEASLFGPREYAGRFTMQADFINSTVSGQAGDFIATGGIGSSSTLDTYSGILGFNSGTITGASFSTNIDGTLTASSGPVTVLSNVSGTFARKDNQDAVFGLGSGTASTSVGSNPIEAYLIGTRR